MLQSPPFSSEPARVPSDLNVIQRSIVRHWPALLVLAVPALLPFARLAELPILVMLIIGSRDLLRRPREALGTPSIRLFVLLFAVYWIPGVVSAIDAVEPGKAWSWVLAQLRFVPVAVFVALRLDATQRRFVLRGAMVLVLFWTVDALVQAAIGRNLLGMPESPDRLNGIFGPTNIKLGLVLAAFAPLALEPVRRGPRGWLIAAYALLLVAILLIGTRAAWIMFAVVTGALLYVYARGRPARGLVATLFVLVVGGILALGAYHGSDDLRDRVDRSLQVLNGDAASIDHAVSLRLPIWQTAVQMGADHWLNGVGVRGFRYAYAEYAEPDDPWAVGGGGATHAHQLLLEAAAETGILGLLGLALGTALALRAWLRANGERRQATLPYAVTLAAMLFPLNTHLAFYSTFWSLVFWWVVALYCVHVMPGRSADPVG